MFTAFTGAAKQRCKQCKLINQFYVALHNILTLNKTFFMSFEIRVFQVDA